MADFSKTISIAGTDYPVATLNIRQIKVVAPVLLRLISELGPLLTQVDAAKEGTSADKLAALGRFEITEQQFDYMVTAIWTTINRWTKISRDEFLDLDTNMTELFAAIPVVLEASGLMDKGAPAVPGEAEPLRVEAT